MPAYASNGEFDKVFLLLERVCKNFDSGLVCSSRASRHLCSVGRHLVCVGGQSTLSDVSQCPQLLLDFILILILQGAPIAFLNEVDFHEFEQSPGQIGI